MDAEGAVVLGPSEELAKKRFELENDVQLLSEDDSVYRFDEEEYYTSIEGTPWKNE
jgi:hypothetical protein